MPYGLFRLPSIRFFPSFFALALVLVATSRAGAQSRLDAAGVGRSGASTASTRGVGAIYSNPGCLDLDPIVPGEGGRTIDVSVYNLGGVLGSTFFNSSEFEQIFAAGKSWPSTEDRRRLGGLLQGERLVGIAANSVLALRWPTSVGTFGFHYAHRILSRLDFPSDFTTILVDNELFNQRYEFVNNGVGADWITQFGLSFGSSIRSASTWFSTIGIGGTVKIIRGIAHFEVGQNSMLTVNRTITGGGIGYRIRGGYSVRSALPDGFDPASTVGGFLTGLFPASAGIGVGLDVGVGGVLFQTPPDDSGIREHVAYFGISLADLGSVRWNKNTRLRHQEQIDDLIPNATLTNEQFSRYQGTLDTIGDFITGLPSKLRVGLALNGQYLGLGFEGLPAFVEVGGELPLNSVPGNESFPKAMIGTTIGVARTLNLRAGLSGGGIDGFGIGLGAGIRPADWLAIDVGTSELDGMLSGNRIDLAFQLVLALSEL